MPWGDPWVWVEIYLIDATPGTSAAATDGHATRDIFITGFPKTDGFGALLFSPSELSELDDDVTVRDYVLEQIDALTAGQTMPGDTVSYEGPLNINLNER